MNISSELRAVLGIGAAVIGAAMLYASAKPNAKPNPKPKPIRAQAKAVATAGSADRTRAEPVLLHTPLLGGCLCGAVRYAITPPDAKAKAAPSTVESEGAGACAAGSGVPLRVDAAYCHCRMCQRSTGAPAVAWATVPVANFRYTAGAPVSYRSSASAVREFCEACGSQLLFRYVAQPEPASAPAPAQGQGQKQAHVDAPVTTVDVTIASLDTPAAVPPRYHIWTMSRVQWFDTADALPRFTDRGLDTSK